MDACLTEDVVASLLDGTLDAARFTSASRHIAECERCMRLVEQVGGALASRDETKPLAQPEELARGARVGRYEILEPLGAGGMGRVYAALDPALDRKVALKLLHGAAASADLEARLLREAKVMARLNHPEVVTILDVGHYGEQLFIAMELVDGGTLRQWLAAAPRAWREVLAVYLRAGRGLARAHAAGIVHRDFKPDNVLVGADGRVRVTDFGLARTDAASDDAPRPLAFASTARPVDAALTRTGTLMGTPAYMAPEQHAAGKSDARSDLYAFCVALWEALCGERPFRGATVAELHAAKLAGRVAIPPGARAPSRVLRVIDKGLRPRPEDRWESMDVLLAALERAARGPRWPALVAAIAVVAIGSGVAAARHRAVASSPPAAAASVAAQGECATDRACVAKHGGAAWRCRASDHACVAIASEDCAPKFEPQDLARDDTVWIGAMFPTRGPLAEEFGALDVDAVDFARSEIAQATRAFDGRRVALVACDDGADPARAARHLVDDVGVPAVLGFRSGQEVVDLAESVLIPRRALAVATLTSSPLITRLPQPSDLPRMVWRTTYDLDAVADVVARVVEEQLAPRDRPGATRVTLLRSDVAGALSFGEKLYAQLRIDGRAASDEGSGYAEVTFAPGDPSPAVLAKTVERVAKSEPSIVVLQGDMATVVPVVAGLEARAATWRRKPTYLAVLYSAATFAPFVGRDADRRRRLFTIESLSSSMPNARYILRFNEKHARQITRTINGGEAYDAFYVLAYAVFASGRDPIDGPRLGRAFARLVGPGEHVEVGPTGLYDALARLGRGERIDLDGTQSGLDFDLTTGDEPSDFALLCVGVDPRGRATERDVESGIVYRASTRRLEGTLRCP